MLEDLKQHRRRERPDGEPVDGVGRKPAIELARLSANGEERADALVPQPPEREQECPGGRSIKPLDVIDRDGKIARLFVGGGKKTADALRARLTPWSGPTISDTGE